MAERGTASEPRPTMRGGTATLTEPARLAAVQRAREALPHCGVPMTGWARLTAMAAGAPMALLSIVGADRVYAVDAHGMPPSQWSTGQASLCYSFCGKVIGRGGTLTIPDAWADPDLRALPVVSDTGARSYLGAPLRGPGGELIGVLGVADYAVRDWPPETVSAVEDAARLISATIAEHQAEPAAGIAGASAADIIDATPDAFVATDVRGYLVGWNAAAEEMYGWTAAEASGQRTIELIVADPEERRWLEEAAARLRAEDAGAGPWKDRRRFTALHRDGHTFPVEAVLSSVVGPAGRVYCGFIRDISEQLATAAELERERDLLRTLLHSLDVSVIVLDLDGRALPNESMTRMGMPEQWSIDNLPELLPVLYHPDGRPVTMDDAPIVRVHRGEVVHGAELRVRMPDGRRMILSISGRPIVAADGRRLGTVVATRDVTGVRSTQLLHACEATVTRILARAGTLHDVAAAVLPPMGEALGASYAEFWLVDPVGGARRLAVRWPDGAESPAGAAPDGRELSVPLVHEERDLGCIVLRGCTLDDATGPFLEGIGTQLAQFVGRRQAEELALELARTKDEFIALAGHTLRTPLTTIVALTELLITAGDELADEREELLRRVCSNAETLRGIVEDLLAMAGLESGHINLSIGPLDLARLLTEAVAAAAPGAARAGVRFAVDAPAELPAHGDRFRLRQAVDNLLSNAVKYGPDGGTVRVRLAADRTVAELTVSDEGLGIPEDERERLFNRFSRGASAHERGIAGTGLGLPLTRLIVERHGGTITLRDDPGPGTTFLVRLPLTPPPSA